MGKTAAIPMDKEIQNFLFIFTGQQYFYFVVDAPFFIAKNTAFCR